MSERHSEPDHRRELRLGLDPLGDDLAVGRRREVDEASHDSLPAHVLVDAPHEVRVDLDDVRPEPNEMSEIRDARPSVIDCESDVESEREDGVAKRAVCRDRLVLGDLKDERPLANAQRTPQRVRVGEKGWRDVDTEPGTTGQLMRVKEGRNKRCPLQGSPEAAYEGGREHFVRCATHRRIASAPRTRPSRRSKGRLSADRPS